MAEAKVGDDVLRDDPTVQKLERRAADLLGKTDALFVPSGTMANQVALHTWMQPGEEFVTEKNSHIYNYEHGMFGTATGAVPRPVPGRRGILDPEDIESAVRPEEYYLSSTTLITVETSHNHAGGTVYPPDTLQEIRTLANRLDLPVHVDGARIFNAATALDVEAREIAQYGDSVMFCLSKGLSAPVGSILAGPEPFIEDALEVRKTFGGGMRQAGVLAAPGLVALDEMRDRLDEDHRRASELADFLMDVEEIQIDPETVQTNILIFNVADTGMTAEEFVAALEKKNIKAGSTGPESVRFVLNRHVDDDDLEAVRNAIHTITGS